MSTFNPYDHFGYLTNRVARLITQNLEPFLESEGYFFPVSCIGILADLWSNDGINQKELGTSLIKTKSSINKMLLALEIEGLIVKKEDPNDGRGKLIYLTQKGKALRTIIEQRGESMEKCLLEECSSQEITTTKMVLEKMYKKLNSLKLSNTKQKIAK